MIRRADTIGVFQIESRAQMSMLPRLKPAKFYDLVIEVAIVRPGPIQGKMVHPYLRRRENPALVTYPAPRGGNPDELREVLGKTLGVPLFQEQAMRIAIVAAGFEPGQADRFRRAMATFKRVGTIHSFETKFVEGMVARGYERDFAQRCFDQIKGFGDYGFPESHAASFADLVYASAWMKCRYPGRVRGRACSMRSRWVFTRSAQIVRDARRAWRRDARARYQCLELGLHAGGGWRGRARPSACAPHRDESSRAFQSRAAARIAADQRIFGRRRQAHRGDARRRLRFHPRSLAAHGPEAGRAERLAAADAFRSLGLDRREALWAIRALRRAGDKDDLPLFARAAMDEIEPDAHLPPMPPGQQVVEDYRHLHLSLKAHPVSFLRAESRRGANILRNEQLPGLPSGRRVTVGGLVLVRQRPGTANGVIFATLEDETAGANVIIWPAVFEKFRPAILGARLIAVTGKLQNASGVIHVVADEIGI